MGNETHGQRGIMVNIKDRDVVPWGMGHMGDGAHGQWGTWAIGHMITSLIRTYKMSPHLLSNLLKALSNLSSNI